MRRAARGVVVEFAQLTDAGRDPAKQVNEDASRYETTAHGHLAVVCDGMGGHEGGRLASQTAVACIIDTLSRTPVGAHCAEALRASIEAAGRKVHEIGGTLPVEARPGTTCVALLLYEGIADVAHVGDSRLYLLRGGEIRRITRDHSMVQQLLDAGVLSEAQALAHPDANRITRALGMLPTVDVEVRPGALAVVSGDVLLLTSDGLTDVVEDVELLALVRENLSAGPEVVCQRLIDTANERGGPDNITVQVLSVVEAPQRPAEATVLDAPAGSVPAQGAREGFRQSEVEPTRPDEPKLRPRKGLAPAPTLVEAPAPKGRRVTEPWIAAAPGSPGAGVSIEGTPAAPLRHPERLKGRWLVIAASLIATAICVGVALWWLLSPPPSQTEPPPAEPVPADSPSSPAPTARLPNAPESRAQPEPTAGGPPKDRHRRGHRHHPGHRELLPEPSASGPSSPAVSDDHPPNQRE